MSASAEPLDPPLATRFPARRIALPRRLEGRPHVWLLAASIALATASLLIPATPSYDPWSWLVWGRELTHGVLHTAGGPTWKPLPVLFTAAFSAAGRAQPDLWLLVARSGAIMAVLMAGRLAARATWRLRTDAVTDDAAPRTRLLCAAPAALACAIAVIAIPLQGGFATAVGLGYSEGLALAALLIGIERHVDGHRRQAFVWGLLVALDRPEIWPFWGLYGLWLAWTDRRARRLVPGLALLCLLLWFAPQELGGGSFTSGVVRAQHPRPSSAAFAHCPFCTELLRHAMPQVLLRLKVVAVLSLGAAVLVLARIGLGRRVVPPPARTGALIALAGAAGFGFGWWVLISLETQLGFSGNDRYLVLGSAAVDLAAAIGFGWAASALAGLAARRSEVARGRPGASAIAASVAAAAVFALVPGWAGRSLASPTKTYHGLAYQAALRRDLAALIESHGGAQRVLGCGAGWILVSGFQVPMVAWYLDTTFRRVDDRPTGRARAKANPWPNVIVQDRDTRGSGLVPAPTTIAKFKRAGGQYSVWQTPTMRLFEDCR